MTNFMKKKIVFLGIPIYNLGIKSEKELGALPVSDVKLKTFLI